MWDAERGRQADRWIGIRDGCIEGVYDSKPGTASEERRAALFTPGLIDMHVHLVWDGSGDPVTTLQAESEQERVIRAVENAQTQLRNGVTTVRDLGSTNDVAITVAAAVRHGQIRGPTVHASGRTIIISGGHDPFWGIESDGVQAVRSAVRVLRNAGADLIKVSATGGVYGQAVGEDPGTAELSREELTAIVEEAHRFDLPVAAHAVGTEGIANAVAAGVDSIEHGNLMHEDALEELISRDIAYDPTLYVYQEIARDAGEAPEYAQANAQRVYERHWETVESAIAANARILAGSDAGSPGTPHPSLHRELDCLVDAGLTETEALTAATLTPARELNRDGLGVLDAGTSADIVGFAKDPLDDIAAAETPKAVVKGGELVRGTF